MPPNFSSRCWAALCAKWPDMTTKDGHTAELIIEGALDAFQRVKPDSVNGVPPDADAMARYFMSQGSTVEESQAFMDYFASVGWVIGANKVKMKDPLAAARNWIRRSANHAPNRAQGQASLFALQEQAKVVRTEIHEILHPGGSAYAIPPGQAKQLRLDQLQLQLKSLQRRIDAF